MNRNIIKTNGHKRHATYSGTDDLRISEPRTTGTCVISTQTQNSTTHSWNSIRIHDRYICLFSIVHNDCVYVFPIVWAVLAYASKKNMESSYLQRLWTTHTYLLYFRKTPIRNAYALLGCLSARWIAASCKVRRKQIYIRSFCMHVDVEDTEREKDDVRRRRHNACMFVRCCTHQTTLSNSVFYVVALRMKREQTSGCSALDRVWMRHIEAAAAARQYAYTNLTRRIAANI